MELSVKHRKIIKTVQAFRKANPDANVAKSLEACKVSPAVWSYLRAKGAVPRVRAPRGQGKNYQKIEAVAPDSAGKLVMVMGSASQIKDFMGLL